MFVKKVRKYLKKKYLTWIKGYICWNDLTEEQKGELLQRKIGTPHSKMQFYKH